MSYLYEVLAWRNVDFTDEKTGKNVRGISLYARTDSMEGGWNGKAVDKFFIPSDSPLLIGYQPAHDQLIEVGFNRYGKINSIKVC